jgi:hypothetical protein
LTGRETVIMGRGSKHSKNAGVMGSEALTYHEKKAMGYGTLKERLGKVLLSLFCRRYASGQGTGRQLQDSG